MPQGSRCVKLSNMLSVGDDHDDIKDDITQECTRFGVVEAVEINEEDSAVLVTMSTKEDAAKLIGALDGRYYAGSQISAQLHM
jgi:hypothetical protein